MLWPGRWRKIGEAFVWTMTLLVLLLVLLEDEDEDEEAGRLCGWSACDEKCCSVKSSNWSQAVFPVKACPVQGISRLRSSASAFFMSHIPSALLFLVFLKLEIFFLFSKTRLGNSLTSEVPICFLVPLIPPVAILP